MRWSISERASRVTCPSRILRPSYSTSTCVSRLYRSSPLRLRPSNRKGRPRCGRDSTDRHSVSGPADQPARPGHGKPGPAPATGCPRAVRQAPRPAATRPYLLGLAGQTLARLASRAAHRQARDRHQVASTGLPTLLALEVASPQAGSPQDQTRDPPPHLPHVPREPRLGCNEEELFLVRLQRQWHN